MVIEDEEERQHTTAASEFLSFHQKFGHILPKKIQVMARRGILPRRLATCPIPVCTACMYGKAARRAWRSKTTDNASEVNVPTKPGECISVDQLISPTPGLIAQITIPRTKLRYNAATVYVDQATGLGFVHLQKGTTADETLESKAAFESFARSHEVNVQQYHADNGIFQDIEMARRMCKVTSNTFICRSWGTPPKRSGRTAHQRTARHGTHNAHSCPPKVAISCVSPSMALSCKNGK